MKTMPMLDLRAEYEYLKPGIDRAIETCLAHQQWILGPEVEYLEKRIAQYIGVRHCIGTSSGTDSLLLALRALAITLKGSEYFDRTDRIITTPLTFTATGEAILRAGATPVFVDIDPVTYNVDPVRIRQRIEDPSGRIVGILPVHLYGRSCGMDEITLMARENRLFVLEDTAQAFGGICQGKRLGSIGTCGAFSFFPAKNLGAFGDAGMVCTDDEELAVVVRRLLRHGGEDKYNADHIGYNARLDTLQAAILLVKLDCIDEFNGRRQRVAHLYTEALRNVEGIVLPVEGVTGFSSVTSLDMCVPESAARQGPNIEDNDDHIFHQYTIRVLHGRRDGLRGYLREKGITSMVYYPVPLHRMKAFDGRHEIFGVPAEAEKAVDEILSLPIGPFLTEEQVMFVAEEIRSFLEGRAA